MFCMYTHISDLISSPDTPPRGIETAKEHLAVIAEKSKTKNMPDK